MRSEKSSVIFSNFLICKGTVYRYEFQKEALLGGASPGPAIKRRLFNPEGRAPARQGHRIDGRYSSDRTSEFHNGCRGGRGRTYDAGAGSGYPHRSNRGSSPYG